MCNAQDVYVNWFTGETDRTNKVYHLTSTDILLTRRAVSPDYLFPTHRGLLLYGSMKVMSLGL